MEDQIAITVIFSFRKPNPCFFFILLVAVFVTIFKPNCERQKMLHDQSLVLSFAACGMEADRHTLILKC